MAEWTNTSPLAARGRLGWASSTTLNVPLKRKRGNRRVDIWTSQAHPSTFTMWERGRKKWVVHQWEKEGAFVQQAQWRTFCCEDSATFNTLMLRCCSRERAAKNLHPDPADLRQTDAVFTARLIPADPSGQTAAAASQSRGARGGGARRGGAI